MILSSALSSAAAGTTLLAPGGALLIVAVAVVLYALAAVPAFSRISAAALVGALVLHALLLVIDIAGIGQAQPGARLGFAPVLSMTVWLVIAVYIVESRLVPLPAVRQGLGIAGLLAVLLCAVFPGEMRPVTSALAPLHFALGVGAYGLFAAAVLHGLLLDQAERRLRGGGPAAARAVQTLGMPLLQLERVTFRFVQAGFVVLTATLLLGFATATQWRWGDHKAVFSLLAWAVFAALLAGRWFSGWRGRRATRWLYAGAVLLLLAYAGSRFVLEVLLDRGTG
jgi:ABC-type uncharacterized transport system permease subunit